jgi:TRAP-type mannitol/chloroaromatic compound transport system substrate-binding protein|tara:strand:+ start:364 stop:1494 length:1131 start_codon:yes stop_codon:yes gene_type:complete
MSDKTKTLKGKTPSRRKFIKAAAATGVAAVAASSLAAPAVAADRVEIAMVTTWPRDFPGLGTGAQRFAQRLTDMSDGRFQVQYFASGERVKAFDSFDEVASGNAQMYHAADYYWKGKHKAWGYFTAVPFGLTYTELNAWIRFAGGQQLWDELGDKFGLKNFLCGNTGVQMGGWFNKKIKSAKDFKGLKMRMPGFGGEVIAKLGASPVSLPGGQIYENLVSGAIDATEWVGPWNDEIMKFQEAAKYYYYPGMHEPGSALAAGCNKSWLTSLSKADQTMIEAASSMENDVMMAEYNAKNGAALARLINDHGVKLEKFNDKVYDAFAKGAAEVFEEVQASSDLAARTHKSFVKARKDIGSWANLSDSPYIQQRNRALGV